MCIVIALLAAIPLVHPTAAELIFVATINRHGARAVLPK
jgi:hypothetical protein